MGLIDAVSKVLLRREYVLARRGGCRVVLDRRRLERLVGRGNLVGVVGSVMRPGPLLAAVVCASSGQY